MTFEQFLSTENLALAYKRIKTAAKNPYKEFYRDDFQYFELFLTENLAQLSFELSEGTYVPSQCEKYYMPKKKNLARPISMLTLIDQIVYQALANVIADKYYPVLSRYFNITTFGNLFVHTQAENNIFFFEKWKIQWKKYNDNKRNAFNNGYRFIADFDIASFYDNIDHGILIQMLENHNVDSQLIDLLKNCLSTWTISNTSNFPFCKSCGIPQGPVSSAFFAEIYLFSLDNYLRARQEIKYFRYADDISIMAKSEDECRKMIVYLDLIARDISLTPQSEKIEIAEIDNIDKHIKSSTLKFSTIAKEYKRNDNQLNLKTHNKLKRQFIACLENPDEFNKSIIRFALFKLNKDEEIKSAIIKHIKSLELFYDGICYYFSIHFPNDPIFDDYVLDYLLGDTVLFQYNKSLLFQNYEPLAFSEDVFQANFNAEKPFWIVQYQLIRWLTRCGREKLAGVSYSGENYYILRSINKIKCEELSGDVVAQKIFIKGLISDQDPLVSMQGLFFWNERFLFDKAQVDTRNGFSKKIIDGYSFDYLSYTMSDLYGLAIPEAFKQLLSSKDGIYVEAKNNFALFRKFKDIDPGKSLMNLNLLHNIFFDAIATNNGYKCEGNFGGNISQMKELFPISAKAFMQIDQARNHKTDAHYKDKFGNLRVRISKSEYKKLLEEIDLQEVYREIFQHYEHLGERK